MSVKNWVMALGAATAVFVTSVGQTQSPLEGGPPDAQTRQQGGPHLVEGIYREIDADGDGAVTIEEFVKHHEERFGGMPPSFGPPPGSGGSEFGGGQGALQGPRGQPNFQAPQDRGFANGRRGGPQGAPFRDRGHAQTGHGQMGHGQMGPPQGPPPRGEHGERGMRNSGQQRGHGIQQGPPRRGEGPQAFGQRGARQGGPPCPHCQGTGVMSREHQGSDQRRMDLPPRRDRRQGPPGAADHPRDGDRPHGRPAFDDAEDE